MTSELLVIGGGPAGYAAAFLAADMEFNVTLVEQRPSLGGVCLLEGCIPSKALLHVAKLLGEAEALANWGIALQKTAVNLDQLRSRKDSLIETLSKGLSQLAQRRNVKVVPGKASFRSAHSVAIEKNDGTTEQLGFDNCIIASGSEPVSLPGLPSDDRIWDSQRALELPYIPERLLVIGGGYIGLELGTVYARLGSQVTIVELTSGLLPGVDRDLVRVLERRAKRLFSSILVSTKVVGIEPTATALKISLEGPQGPQLLEVDAVLVAIGRRPNTMELGLENTRITTDAKGFIQTDHQQRTREPHIFAVGDVAGQPMLAHKATHQAKVAVEAIAGEPAEFAPRAIPAVVFTDPEIAWAGLTETEASEGGIEFHKAVFPWAASGRAQAEGSADGMTKWLVDARTERLIGCAIVGNGASELISEAVLAIEMGAQVRDVAETIHPHPTLSETLGLAAEIHLGTCTDVYRPQKR